MADRLYRDLELPDFPANKSLAAPDAGFIQVYGRDGKLIVHNSQGVVIEVGAGGSYTPSPPTMVTTSTYTATSSDTTLLVTVASTITLPLASASSGRAYNIKRVTSDAPVLIVASGSDTIDGNTTIELTEIYASISVISNGVAWWIY